MDILCKLQDHVLVSWTIKEVRNVREGLSLHNYEYMFGHNIVPRHNFVLDVELMVQWNRGTLAIQRIHAR